MQLLAVFVHDRCSVHIDTVSGARTRSSAQMADSQRTALCHPVTLDMLFRCFGSLLVQLWAPGDVACHRWDQLPYRTMSRVRETQRCLYFLIKSCRLSMQEIKRMGRVHKVWGKSFNQHWRGFLGSVVVCVTFCEIHDPLSFPMGSEFVGLVQRYLQAMHLTNHASSEAFYEQEADATSREAWGYGVFTGVLDLAAVRVAALSAFLSFQSFAIPQLDSGQSMGPSRSSLTSQRLPSGLSSRKTPRWANCARIRSDSA
jgi:hypothetical protein